MALDLVQLRRILYYSETPDTERLFKLVGCVIVCNCVSVSAGIDPSQIPSHLNQSQWRRNHRSPWMRKWKVAWSMVTVPSLI